MKMLTAIFATAALLASANAQAAPLTVVNVNAPNINCVFDVSCTIVVNDTTGKLTYTQFGGGFFQSRVFPTAKAPMPGAGNIAYLYRLDLTQANTFADCVVGATVNFGPPAKPPYLPNTPAHVFVITTGCIGTVGIASAEQDGAAITFTFSAPVCGGVSSRFFGLAAAQPPVSLPATVFGFGNPPIIQIDARVPQH
jgi:hypothetical protein